jgi:hypothetical protein
MNDLVSWLGKLYGLPGYVLVALSCIVLGYILRAARSFPNGAIPLACVLWAATLTPILSDATPAGVSHTEWRLRCALIGMVVGFCAWVFHRAVLSRFEDRIPGLSKILGEDEPVKPVSLAGTIEQPKP